MKYRLVLLLLALGTAPAVVSFQALTHRPTETGDGAPTAEASVAAPRPAFRGVAGCSAQACHGGPPTDGPVTTRNAATFWLDHDRHADAFAVLRTPRSRQIVENLAAGAAAPPHQDARCLACHTIPQTVYAADQWEILADDAATTELRRDGVGCEACHGSSRAWLGPHQTNAWVERRSANYRATNMTGLNDLTVRAELCAGCHVGAPADKAHNLPVRDVNHDLIAAGHPRLSFELASYQAALPPHWIEVELTDGEPRPRPPATAARLWLAGQAATATAALDLRRDRAERGPWPEFAESDCFACHHDLGAESWRQQTSGYYDNRSPGVPPWNRWHLSRPFERWLAEGEDGAEVRSVLTDLRSRLSQANPPRRADQSQVEKAAALVRTSMARRDDAQRTDDDLLRRLHAVSELPPGDGDSGLGSLSWDDAIQYYFLLAALHAARPDDRRGPATATLTALGRQLSLPRAPNAFDSPNRFRRDDVPGKKLRESFDQLRQALKP